MFARVEFHALPITHYEISGERYMSEIEKPSEVSEKNQRGLKAMKALFAMEYVLQGLANPFQGITYHSFFKHFRVNYGLSEAATQQYFSRAYLAWSFKPLIGFLMDAYCKTKITLIILLIGGAILYFITPFLDTSEKIFFAIMFLLAILFAWTDVAVDRATVLEGDEEAKSSGRSKAATVGLNQAICWAAIYGTGIFSNATGGWIADNINIKYLLYLLALVPLIVLIVVLMLPKDTASSIPLKESITNFWNGLNTGPVLWIILFYFLFHFQPSLGALWTNHLMVNLHFTQTQIGYADASAYFGYFTGVLLFAFIGIRWQDRLGLRNVFKIFIILCIMVNLTQYLLVDPWFTRVTGTIHCVLPSYSEKFIRLLYLAVYNFFSAVLISLTRMSTFSLVGAVIPVNAAGSLFAGFMSVANLAYSFSYASGSWLYENGLNYGIFQFFERNLFGHPGLPGDTMSISLLIFIGSMAYLLSFASVHMLPDKRQTQSVEDDITYLEGPERYRIMGDKFLKTIDIISISLYFTLFLILFGPHFNTRLDIFLIFTNFITSTILAFFITAFLRKIFLDWKYKNFIQNKN